MPEQAIGAAQRYRLPLLSFDPGGFHGASPRRACPDVRKHTRCESTSQIFTAKGEWTRRFLISRRLSSRFSPLRGEKRFPFANSLQRQYNRIIIIQELMERETPPYLGWLWRSLSSGEVPLVTQSKSQAEVRLVQNLLNQLGLRVKNLELFERALTHSSFVNETSTASTDNERLEFLGDAVLDFVVGAYVYNHFPEMKEGEMTKLRSALVRTEQLAEFARRLDLGSALRLGRGELASGGHQRDSLLCGAFEAFVGALFLDTDLPTAKKFIEPFLESARGTILAQASLADAKSRLQEWSQAEHLGPPIYLIISSSGPEHARVFEVAVRVDSKELGRGLGSSKSVAEQEAAQAALKWLGLD